MQESSYILDSVSPINQNKNESSKKNSPKLKQSYTNKGSDTSTEIHQTVEFSQNQILQIEKDIILIKNKLDTTINQISILQESLSCIPASYSQSIYEIEKSKIEDHLKIELGNKNSLEKLLEIKTQEFQLKSEEIKLKKIEKDKDKLLSDRLMMEKITDIDKAKIDLEMARKSLISRQLFYEKEIEDLNKAENSIRESLITLGINSGEKHSLYELQIENLRKDIQIQRILYNNKLQEFGAKSFSREDIFEIDYLAEKIKKNEEEMNILEIKKIEENLRSPNKKLAFLKLEGQLVN